MKRSAEDRHRSGSAVGRPSMLVAADRTLATTAISEGGSPKALATANSELAKGDADRSQGKFDAAIDHYKKAWKALNG